MTELEKRQEPADDAINEMRQLVKKWDDRLTLDNLRIAERYLKGEVEFLIHLQVRAVGPSDSRHFCVVVKNWNADSLSEGHCAVDFRIHAPLDLGDQVAHGRMPELQQIWRERRSKTEAKILDGEGDNRQEAVLVEVVKLVEFPEAIVPALVRLGRVDETYRGRAHSLYLSRRAGFVFGETLANGEVSPVATGLPVCLNQLPRQVVEAASQLVSGFADDQGDVLGQRVSDLDAKDALSGLRVLLTQKSVWVGFAEGQNPGFEITDVVFGPFDFCPDS